MEDRWQRQLQAIEEKTQRFRRPTTGKIGRTSVGVGGLEARSLAQSSLGSSRVGSTYSHTNHHLSSSRRYRSTASSSSALRSSSMANRRAAGTGVAAATVASGRISPQNLTRSSNIGLIGSRIYGPTVEDAMHEFSKRTTDIMKVMHTVGSELAQVQHALGSRGDCLLYTSPSPRDRG